ncbi:MAG: SRPBCC domain-containing protein [Leptospirales bacterium]|nr:SRPBCC domain-containing protein [Leptospirales bacterium]
MLPPLVKTIDVPCSQEMAFTVFLNDMQSWWPLGKFSVSAMGGKPSKSLRVDAKQGGQIVETTADDREYLWGIIQTYDPYDYLSMDFHIPQPMEKVESRSFLELRFTALGPELTRVELKQSNWEAFGENAAMLQGGYGKGWAIIFEQSFRVACGG